MYLLISWEMIANLWDSRSTLWEPLLV